MQEPVKKRTFQYLVLGLGGIGSAAAYWLTKLAGNDVLGLEQFALGHIRGGSQDHSRIIRLSYHNPFYVNLAKEAYRAWAAVEADSGEQLVYKTGGLDLSPAGSRLPLSDYTNSLTALNIPYELLDASEIMRRWPQWQLPDDVRGLYQAESGLVAAAKSNAAHQRLAREYGATLRDDAPVTDIHASGNEISVVAGGETYTCEKLVIASGAWSNQLLAHFGLNINLTVTQEQVTYYASPHLADFALERFPIWIWLDEPCYYGFPAFGEAGPKIAQDVGGQETTAESRTFAVDTAAFQRTDTFLRQHLPTAHGPVITSKTCLYTMPPDRDFVLDTLPEYPNVAVAVGAGHAFKFASLLGKILSQLAISGKSEYDLTPFQISRPILFAENPVKEFMV
ncbi:MAG: N-methyl-L-tryptophan oxidase [Anaerolineaceae bacterium]|nr:N-methyl-L-tryptophan oxidase [Anaerolineaceae bacterium]